MLLGAAASVLWVGAAAAQQVGAPVAGGLTLQKAATPLQQQIIEFHSLVLVIITAITLLVLALLAGWFCATIGASTPSRAVSPTTPPLRLCGPSRQR